MEEKKKQLFDLIGQCELEGARDLLKSFRTDEERAELINSTIDDGSTILHVAANNQDTEMIQWILSDEGGRAVGFNKILVLTDDIGKTALYISAKAGDFKSLTAIMEGCKVENGERAAILNAVTFGGWTVLHAVVWLRRMSIIQWILSDLGGRAAGFNKLLAKTEDGQETALHFATERESLDIFRTLVEGSQVENGERAAFISSVNSHGATVLHFALERGRSEIVAWMLSEEGKEAGFDREYLFALTMPDKSSVLHCAARGGSIDCFEAVLAACDNSADWLRLFLGRDDKGWTIFHHAAHFSQADMISHILEKYPEESKMIIDMRDNRGMTVLHRTIIGGIDEESREEWGDWRMQLAKSVIVAALLGGSTTAEAAQESSRVTTADPNIDLKFS